MIGEPQLHGSSAISRKICLQRSDRFIAGPNSKAHQTTHRSNFSFLRNVATIPSSPVRRTKPNSNATILRLKIMIDFQKLPLVLRTADRGRYCFELQSGDAPFGNDTSFAVGFLSRIAFRTRKGSHSVSGKAFPTLNSVSLTRRLIAPQLIGLHLNIHFK